MPTKKITTPSSSTKKTTATKTSPSPKKAPEPAAKPAVAEKETAPLAPTGIVGGNFGRPLLDVAEKETAPPAPTATAQPAAAPAVAAEPPAEAPAEKTATAAKKTTATAAPAKAEAPKKAPAKKKPAATATTVVAKVDIGYGNALYIRGEGAELSWTQGILMENKSGDEWSWSTQTASGPLMFKFLINDEIWSAGDNHTVAPGDTAISSPTF